MESERLTDALGQELHPGDIVLVRRLAKTPDVGHRVLFGTVDDRRSSSPHEVRIPVNRVRGRLEPWKYQSAYLVSWFESEDLVKVQ